MSQEHWSAVDHYLNEVLAPEDRALLASLEASQAAGMPAISVTPTQGKFLHVLARAVGAKRILEIGTLGGYSAIWMARALPPGGRLVSLEMEPKHADVARASLERAGVMDRVQIRVGAALELLPKLAAEGAGPFDLVFVDADKASMPEYFDWALKLSRPGTLIVLDNVIREGAVIDPASEDPSVRGVRRLNERMAAERRVVVTALQTVGSKGYDGFAIAVVTS
jgi:predicted O-methyltransferase YrrM